MRLTFKMLKDGDDFTVDGVEYRKQREYSPAQWNAAIQDPSFDYDNKSPLVRFKDDQVVGMEEEENKAILFLAQLIRGKAAEGQGRTHTTLWLCTASEYQEEYITKAEQMVNEWWANEIAAKKGREDDNLLTYFSKI